MLTCSDIGTDALGRLLAPWGLGLVSVPDDADIPGSYWGAPEAGLVGERVYVRDGTPVHSVLHEACHAICMTPERRAALDTDAGGNDEEESAVCYLQILLADDLPGVGGATLMADMDAWGYSFRRGSTRAWFETDAEDAREWLVERGLLGKEGLEVLRSWGRGVLRS